MSVDMQVAMAGAIVSRSLSPDPHIQAPDYSQSFNRYSYVWNNPLKYTDPSGEFVVLDSWLAGFVHGFFSTSKGRWKAGWKEANLRAGNDAKIWGGLFVTDPNKSFGGRVWELISRFTWQLPQTTGGFYTSHAHNTYGFRGGVESVDYAGGATVVRTRKGGWGAIAQGSFIVGDNRLRADTSTSLFQHEYGHYIQSQRFGLFYYSKVGIPSLISASGRRTHNRHLVEQDANMRAFKYFSKHIEDFNWVDENGH